MQESHVFYDDYFMLEDDGPDLAEAAVVASVVREKRQTKGEDDHAAGSGDYAGEYYDMEDDGGFYDGDYMYIDGGETGGATDDANRIFVRIVLDLDRPWDPKLAHQG